MSNSGPRIESAFSRRVGQRTNSARWTLAHSVERVSGHAVVLNIQGTTELDFNGRGSREQGPLS